MPLGCNWQIEQELANPAASLSASATYDTLADLLRKQVGAILISFEAVCYAECGTNLPLPPAQQLAVRGQFAHFTCGVQGLGFGLCKFTRLNILKCSLHPFM
jgi:hypothetical protein